MDGLTEQDWMESKEVEQELQRVHDRIWAEAEKTGEAPIVTIRKVNWEQMSVKEMLREEAPDEYLEPEQLVTRYRWVPASKLAPGQKELVERARKEAWIKQAPEMIPPEDPENPPENWLQLLEGPDLMW